MTSGTDISALYLEFTNALTEVLAENSVARHVVDDLLGLALPSRNIPTTANMNIFWRSKLLSNNGRPFKIPVVRSENGYALSRAVRCYLAYA